MYSLHYTHSVLCKMNTVALDIVLAMVIIHNYIRFGYVGPNVMTKYSCIYHHQTGFIDNLKGMHA